MNAVRVGIIGIGNMGSAHAKTINQGKIKGAVLTAISDMRESAKAWAADNLQGEVQYFQDPKAMMLSGKLMQSLLLHLIISIRSLPYWHLIKGFMFL